MRRSWDTNTIDSVGHLILFNSFRSLFHTHPSDDTRRLNIVERATIQCNITDYSDVLYMLNEVAKVNVGLHQGDQKRCTFSSAAEMIFTPM